MILNDGEDVFAALNDLIENAAQDRILTAYVTSTLEAIISGINRIIRW